jgi:hypothetical protein
MSQAARSGLMARAVDDAMSTVASREVRERLLRAALASADLAGVPEDAEAARMFVLGPLRTVVVHHLGIEIADAVIEDLEPILSMAGSHLRPCEPRPIHRPPHRRHTDEPTDRAKDPLKRSGAVPRWTEPETRPQPVPSAGAMGSVLVATMDRSGIQRLTRRLVGSAEVRLARDVFELVFALEASGKRLPVVVLDCCLPAVEPQTVAQMLSRVRQMPSVVLWGASEQAHRHLANAAPAAADWVPVSQEADDRDLAALLERMLAR